jgi:hypothetical protein
VSERITRRTIATTLRNVVALSLCVPAPPSASRGAAG